MNRKQKTKLAGVICLIVILGVALALILYALKQNINLFYTPTQLSQTHINPEQNLRVGGYVKKNSVHYDTSGSSVSFTIMDPGSEVTVHFSGVLPNLFREGQGVVVTGKLVDPRNLQASEVLAKHDEKYVPRYLSEELDKKK
jgi:cytochrome c-type biogenesis protein CcmE